MPLHKVHMFHFSIYFTLHTHMYSQFSCCHVESSCVGPRGVECLRVIIILMFQQLPLISGSYVNVFT